VKYYYIQDSTSKHLRPFKKRLKTKPENARVAQPLVRRCESLQAEKIFNLIPEED